MSNKKLLFVVNVDWFFVSHRLAIAQQALNNGYDVHIATSITDQYQKLVESGIRVHPLQLHRSSSGLISLLSELIEIYSVIRVVSPDVIHLVTIKPVLLGGVASRLAKAPAVVFAISGLGHIFLSTGWRAKLRKLFVSLLYRFALGNKNQTVIFQNQDDRGKLDGIVENIENHSVQIPGSGVDLSVFKYTPLSSDMPVVILPSRLLAEKGVYEFVEAAKIVNKSKKIARFVLAGDIDQYNPSSVNTTDISDWKNQDAVEHLGWCDDMHSVLSNAAIIALPSYREGFPKALIEAAACGRAVVTTDVPGCRDAIEEGVTGLLVPVKDANALAMAIKSLLDDPERCAEMGRAGRKRAEEIFDVNMVVEKHMEIYQELLSCR